MSKQNFTHREKHFRGEPPLKKEEEFTGKLFVKCRSCTRPYYRGEKYPKEVCPICVMTGIKVEEEEDGK